MYLFLYYLIKKNKNKIQKQTRLHEINNAQMQREHNK